MKRPPPPRSVLALALASLLAATGCKQEATTSALSAKAGGAAIQSAEPTSFAEVTAKLDPGGHTYVYLSTEQWLADLSGKLATLRSLLAAIPDLTPEDRENLDKAFNVLTKLIQQSGVEEVSGFGMSSIARETNLYHSKLVLHHDPGKSAGFLWKVFGQKPHALDGHDLLPATTAQASFIDLDAPLAWSVIQKQAGQSGFPQADQLLSKLPDGFEQATGLAWDRVLASLGGEVGFAITLDDTKVISIPASGNGDPLRIPEPALLLVAKVKDDTIFNRLDQALTQYGGQQIIKADKPDLKLRTWPLPMPLPIQLRPTVASAEGYLLISTTDAIIQEALAVKAGQKPGLKSNAEFQRLAKDVPAQGNGFTFTSQRFSQTMAKVQQQAWEMTGNAAGARAALLQSLFGSGKLMASYAVAVNTEQGWLGMANGNQHPARWLALSAVLPAGIVSAIAIPNFVKGRQAAQQNACINNLRQIDAAKKLWALENSKADTDTPTCEDLIPFFRNKQFPTCPAGGTYTIHCVSAPPGCSHAGHKLSN